MMQRGGRHPCPEEEREAQGPGESDKDVLLANSIETAQRLVLRVSHDFNNLIAVVRGYAQVLQSRPLLDADSKRIASLIEQAAAEVAAITDRMARFADTGPREQAPSNLTRIVGELVAQERGRTPPGVELQVELEEPLPDVVGDEAQLRQACWHVWQNAIEAMPEGGRLSCQTSTHWTSNRHVPGQPSGGPSCFVRLRVSDSGEGMDAETSAAMFAPFFTTRPGKVRGLGGTVVYRTVRAHGGFIEVTSEVGSGACVDLYFPVVDGVCGPASSRNGPPG